MLASTPISNGTRRNPFGADHRHHRDHRETPDVEDDGGREDALQHGQTPQLPQGAADASRDAVGRRGDVLADAGQTEQQRECESVGSGGEQVRPIHPGQGIQRPAEHRAEDAGAGTRDRIQAHRGPDPVAARDVGEQRSTYREVQHPRETRYERAGSHVPDGQAAE